MKAQTESVIASICAADETIKKADMVAALSLLRGDKRELAPECDTPLTRSEAAAMLRVSRATVTTWAMRGIIRRMEIKGRRKALGYSRSSVYALLNGSGEGNEIGMVQILEKCTTGVAVLLFLREPSTPLY